MCSGSHSCDFILFLSDFRAPCVYSHSPIWSHKFMCKFWFWGECFSEMISEIEVDIISSAIHFLSTLERWFFPSFLIIYNNNLSWLSMDWGPAFAQRPWHVLLHLILLQPCDRSYYDPYNFQKCCLFTSVLFWSPSLQLESKLHEGRDHFCWF